MKKIAFVLGGANTLHEEFDRALSIVEPDTIIATNNAGRDFPTDLPHWVTLHTELMPGWMAERKAMACQMLARCGLLILKRSRRNTRVSIITFPAGMGHQGC